VGQLAGGGKVFQNDVEDQIRGLNTHLKAIGPREGKNEWRKQTIEGAIRKVLLRTDKVIKKNQRSSRQKGPSPGL